MWLRLALNSLHIPVGLELSVVLFTLSRADTIGVYHHHVCLGFVLGQDPDYIVQVVSKLEAPPVSAP